MQRLFENDQYESYTAEATVLETLTQKAVKDIIEAYLKDGYSFRDISSIMKLTIDLEILKS